MSDIVLNLVAKNSWKIAVKPNETADYFSFELKQKFDFLRKRLVILKRIRIIIRQQNEREI